MRHKIAFCTIIITTISTAVSAMDWQCDNGYQDADFILYDGKSAAEAENEKRLQPFKQEISKLLADNDNLSHLKKDSPLLDYRLYTHCLEFLPKLLAKKANPNVSNAYTTPLNLAICAYKPHAMELLLNAGAEVNDSVDSIPLLYAIRCGYMDGVAILLQHSANPNLLRKAPMLNLNTTTPLIEAISHGIYSLALAENRTAIVVLLLHYGADPLQEVSGKTVLDHMREDFSKFKIHGDTVTNSTKYSPSTYQKIGRAFVQYKILFNTLHENQCWPAETVVNILRFVDYGLEEVELSNS